ncbi:hypothetical protein GCM10023144_13190 [Pigmentiphaga soli]|uniref:AsmA domain-containing protein n=1 Tax=Pigmentiphaga soli TaxID=1007095 RepID=A0ABP8GPV8_9BURK
MDKKAKIAISVAAVLAVLVAAALLTDWRFLRGPVERIATKQLGRPVSLAEFRMALRPTLRIHLGGLQVANVPGGQPDRMADVEAIDARIRLLPLLRKAVRIETLAVRGGEVHLARDKDGSNNWTLPEREDKKEDDTPPDVQLKTLTLDRVDVYYDDRPLDVTAHLRASTPTGQPIAVPGNGNAGGSAASAAGSGSASSAPAPASSTPAAPAAPSAAAPNATPAGPEYGLRLDFDGHYHGGAFGGTAFTGGILTLRDSGTPFPFLIDGKGGDTRVHAQGQIGDVLGAAQVDVALDIAGPTLSKLYPFINLPLPDTPPYRIRGRLHREGMNFRLTGMRGTIGSTDIAGDATYEQRTERPKLTAQLKSRVLDIKDLGPLIGTGDKGSKQKTPKPPDPEGRVLPANEFHIGRLNAIDADVSLDAGSVRYEGPWAFDDFSVHLLLNDGVLKLTPLNFGYAGGLLRSDITLDARQPVIRTDAQIALRRGQLSRLFPNIELMKKSDGTLGADVRLKTTGNSVRTMLGRADGTIGLAVTGGDLSVLLMEVVGLDAGQALGYLVGGDRKTRLRCAVSTFDVDKGLAKVQGMVLDTEDTRINGSGSIDFGSEKLAVRLEPLPKDKSILSLRSPVNIIGTFGKPGFSIDKTRLFARAGAAVALGLINPLAALIPLIETGPGTDANCQALLSEVRGAAANSKAPVPTKKAPAAGGAGR